MTFNISNFAMQGRRTSKESVKRLTMEKGKRMSRHTVRSRNKNMGNDMKVFQANLMVMDLAPLLLSSSMS